MGSTTYMHIWRGASFKNKWIEAKKNNSNVLKGEIPWRNDKGTIKSTWNISLIYSFSENWAHPCTSQSKMMHFEKNLSGNCQAYALNTQNMTNSTLVSPFKMEYGWNFSISGLKMMMKSGHFYYWILIKSTNSVIEITWWAHGEISKIFFLDHFSSSFLGQKW